MCSLLRFRSLLAVAVLALSSGCGGQPGTTTYACDPQCPGGTHCTADGCVLDDDNGRFDGSVPDLGEGCQPACVDPTPRCNASRQCVACLTDDHCPIGQRCASFGAGNLCVPGCANDARCGGGGGGDAAKRCCGGQCVDTGSDAANCGGCGMACATKNAEATCVQGACASASCSAGWADCNNNPADGCEVNLHASKDNCGTCGTVCALPNAIAACSGSCYLAGCTFGYDDCNGNPEDGCEVSVLADARNCGACTVVCPVVPHARINCVNASCQLTSCDQGFADCDGNSVNGCETTIGTDAKNCGACGNACGQGLVCRNGGCTCPQCSIPNAKAACMNNMCVLLSCVDGYADCDGQLMNGCEVVTATDPKNCGHCGTVCPMNMAGCDKGACTDQFYGLLSYWKFDGNANDSVAQNNLAAPNGQQLPGFAAGKVGQATNSPMGDPQNMWIPVMPNGINNAADFTLAFWARSNASTWYDSYAIWDSGGIVVYRHQQDNWRLLVWTQDINNSVVQLDSGVNLPAPPDQSWFFVVVYRAGNTLGVKINDAAPVTINVGQLKQGPSLYVSRNNAGYSWPGQLDEMGYWTRALTPGEMTALFNKGDGRTFP